MAEQRVITKQLAAVEDLERGVGKTTQKRGSGNVEVTKVNVTELQGAIVVDTIDAMEALVIDDLGEKTCFVKDLNRGGKFIYDDTAVAEDNQGTNFNGWIRQYSGQVNVKWFIDDDIDHTDAFQRASEFLLPLVEAGAYTITEFINSKFDVQDGATFAGYEVMSTRKSISNNKLLCSFDMEHEVGKGNLQGAIIHDDILYAYRNVKDNDLGRYSYSPQESGKIVKYELKTDGTECTKISEVDIDKFGHQSLSYFTDDTNALFLVNSGGTPDDDIDVDILEYSGQTTTGVYANAGREIAVYDVTNNTNTLYRVMPEYDELDIKGTRWFRGVPFASPDGKTLTILFSDIQYTPRKLVRTYDLQKLIEGTISYVQFDSEFVLDVENNIQTSDYWMQGILTEKDSIFIQFGAEGADKSKIILKYSLSGTLLDRFNYFPSFLKPSNFNHIEPEGLSIWNGNIISLIHSKNAEDVWLNYILIHCIGNQKGVPELKPPAKYSSALAIDTMVPAGHAYNIFSYDEETEKCERLANLTSYGNPQYSGTYLGLKSTVDNPDGFKPLAYSTEEGKDVLYIRGNGTTVAQGAGINLYGINDTDVNGADIHFFGDDFIFKNHNTQEGLAVITNAGNFRGHSYFGLEYDYDTNTYKQVLTRDIDNKQLHLRAKNQLSEGGGINLYDDDHPTLSYSTKLFGQASLGGHLLIDDLETTDPLIAGALWNDAGTLKISAG